MYNKLFTKILDSSIWLESDSTRLVWLTLLSAMDEDGFAQFASIANLAHRARVAPEACAEAVKCLEDPDANSGDPDHEGRRIERVNGGWIILNAGKYRLMVTRVIAREQTRERVRRFRAKSCNAAVTEANDKVTPSEAVTEAVTDAVKSAQKQSTHHPLITKRNLHAEFQHPRFDVPTTWHLQNVNSLAGGEARMRKFYQWLVERVERTNEDTVPRFDWLNRCLKDWLASDTPQISSVPSPEATRKMIADREEAARQWRERSK